MHFVLPTHFQARLRLYGIDDAVCAHLRRIFPIIEPGIAAAIESFIEAEKLMPTVAAIFQQHEGLIRDLMLSHARLLLRGDIDQHYARSCQHVSEQQHRIGLTPRTQMIASNMLQRAALDALGARFRFSPRKIVAGGNIVAQALAFDIATTLTLYQDAASDALQARTRQVDQAIADFRIAINDTIGAVKDVSQALTGGLAGMRKTAEETSQQMKSTAEASDATTSVVEEAAAATSQLSQSIDEIGVQSTNSLQLANGAARGADVSLENLRILSKAVEQIQSVAGMISDIAGQTNLLALNATIEAARAGGAGKGFAVVAGEVKALANQTEKATESISRQIAAIQSAADTLSSQLGSVAGAVRDIAAMAARIASAVHEQTAATREIAASVQTAAQYTIRAKDDVRAVESGTSQSLDLVQEVSELTERLSSRADDLERKVAAFFESVRAA